LSALDAEAFREQFKTWTSEFIEISKGVICLDGKVIRRSHDTSKGIGALHTISAWAHETSITLAQHAVDSKSNEIAELPNLIEDLDLNGQIVTIDAMGCQRLICERILAKGGNYAISLKGNQGTLHDNVKTWFENPPYPDEIQTYKQTEKNRGRFEKRTCSVTDTITWLQQEHAWPGLRSIASIESSREINGTISHEIRYFISSLTADAAKIAYAVRARWGIENFSSLGTRCFLMHQKFSLLFADGA